MLHECSMAALWPVPRAPFSVDRHADMGSANPYPYHVSHLHEGSRSGVEPDARKLNGVATFELDTSYAGMMGVWEGRRMRGRERGRKRVREGKGNSDRELWRGKITIRGGN